VHHRVARPDRLHHRRGDRGVIGIANGFATVTAAQRVVPGNDRVRDHAEAGEHVQSAKFGVLVGIKARIVHGTIVPDITADLLGRSASSRSEQLG
jgi:hypothetical protein